MRYSEFKKEVIRSGYAIEENDTNIRIKNGFGEIYAEINCKYQYRFDADWDMNISEKLFDTIVELARTPLVERQEEKLYYVKLLNVKRGGETIYLTKVDSKKNPIGIDWSNEDYIKDGENHFRFTEKEIKEIDERYWPFAEEVVK